jgi:DNA-binding Lrp family transcriptional regulator
MCRVDAVDRKIIAELQQDGRLTVTELAARVQLSVSPCHRRVRELERTGVIRGYRAVIDRSAMGLNFEAVVFVSFRQTNRNLVEKFERKMAELPEVVQAERLFGELDYLLRVVTKDLTAYQQFYDEHLATIEGVQRATSTIVMKHIVDP